LGIDTYQRPVCFENIKPSCSENLKRHFILQVAPQWERIFRSGISEPLLKDLYACPVLRGKLISFLFHSDGMAFCLFLLFGFLLSFSVVRSIFYSSFSAETLTLSNEELFLSEVSE
jgi:hypothetical protein